MPEQLRAALDAVRGWPVLAGAAYGWAAPPPDPALARYLGSVAAWPLIGLQVAPEDRGPLAALWRQRPDLREVLAEAVGATVCPELERAMLRQVLDGGRADLARWVAAFPGLREPLVAYFEARTRRFDHPLDVVDACAVLVRVFGAGHERWRAAAFALHVDPRREREGAASGFLSPELELAGALTGPELHELNDALLGVGGEPLGVLRLVTWWQPVPRAPADLLARVARASLGAAGTRWGLHDLEGYARALVALDPAERARFPADSEALRRIRMRSIELSR